MRFVLIAAVPPAERDRSLRRTVFQTKVTIFLRVTGRAKQRNPQVNQLFCAKTAGGRRLGGQELANVIAVFAAGFCRTDVAKCFELLHPPRGVNARQNPR